MHQKEGQVVIYCLYVFFVCVDIRLFFVVLTELEVLEVLEVAGCSCRLQHYLLFVAVCCIVVRRVYWYGTVAR